MKGVKILTHQFNGPDETHIIALSDKLEDQLENLFVHTIYTQLKRLAGLTVVDIPRNIIVDETRDGKKYCHVFTRCNDTILIETVRDISKQDADLVLLKMPRNIKPRKCPEMRDIRLVAVDYTLKSYPEWVDEWLPLVNT